MSATALLDRVDLPLRFAALLSITKAETARAGDWIIEGYVATTDLDLQGDQITAEAIRNSARDLLKYRTLLYNHDQNRPIGRVLDSSADERGLYIKARISKSEPEIWQKIIDGTLNKFSIRGDVLEMERVFIPALNRPGRVIKRMRLVEASVVSVPANAEAESIAGYIAKALNEKEATMSEKEKTGGTADAPPPQIEKTVGVTVDPAKTGTETVTPPPPPPPAPELVEKAVLTDLDVTRIVTAVAAEIKKQEPAPTDPPPPPENPKAQEVMNALDQLEAWCSKVEKPEEALALIASIRSALGLAKADGSTPPPVSTEMPKIEKGIEDAITTLSEGVMEIAKAVGDLKAGKMGGLKKSQTGDPAPEDKNKKPAAANHLKGSFREAIRAAVERL